MKNSYFTKTNKYSLCMLIGLSILIFIQPVSAGVKNHLQKPDSLFNSYKGLIVDINSREKLPYASLTVENTNISTVTNADGEFLLKVPKTDTNRMVVITFLGYGSKKISLSALQPDGNKIELRSLPIFLPELEVVSKDPQFLIRKMFDKRTENYSNKDMIMNAFYRETIRKRNTNVSLSEAIVEVYKQSYNNNLTDMAALYKSRKSTDYSKLDTLVYKLMGGPFNSLYLDVMKYPDFIFTSDILNNYSFRFLQTDRIDERLIYVIGFEQLKHVIEPLFYGKLYIDAESYALVRADFDMNLTDNDEATKLFIRKKPFNAVVNTTKAHYQIEYRLNDDKWYYAYSRVDLNMKINWKKKLFNTYYNSTIEMASTDWFEDVNKKGFKMKDRINPNVVIQDAVTGFYDPVFWGEYNIIEPDKSIENAINKIQKKNKK
ncbi:MAG TPA: carboxypeptidase-like regulatory domain-containing protein [Paludibacteraceae bacterium]|nr:carboxypeptidase-like regulatory domain-containing protein [Paludibacteraceae bacterium]